MKILEINTVKGIEKINPYRFAARIAYNRLKWDLSRNSITSRSHLSKLKNKYVGEKAIIICNGPSLNNVDFSVLKNVKTFGLNKINFLFSEKKFEPDFVVAVNRHVLEQNMEFYNQTHLPLFLDSKCHREIPYRPNITYLHSTPIKHFARDLSSSINQGGTVTYVAMQLAYHMGFSKLALVGCDHYFKENGPSNTLVISDQDDQNHFSKDYFAKGQSWQLPDIPQSEYSYSLAKEFFEADERVIYNATTGGHLEIFDRISLKEFIEL